MSPIYVPGKVTLAKESVAADPYYNNVSLLLHGDGSNGSTTITDSGPSPKTVTAFGNAQIITAQSKFGGASIAFDGSGDYISAGTSNDFVFGTADFTIEFWAYPTNFANYRIIWDNRTSDSDVNGFVLGFSAVNIYLYTSSNFRISGSLPSLNQWSHVALTREADKHKIFVNGLQAGSTYTANNNYTRNSSQIGRYFLTNNDNYSGYIDDFRITKGVARYTSNFTPPTAPFPEVLG